jgi:hypothetical protein
LWSLHRDGKAASCEVRFVPQGTEVRMLRAGSLLMSRIFSSGKDALAWAEEEQERLVADGWMVESRGQVGLDRTADNVRVKPRVHVL